MLDKKYEFYITSLLITMLMSLVISGVLVAINLGLINNFLFVWANAWWKAWLVAFPSILFIIPIVKKLMIKIIKN